MSALASTVGFLNIGAHSTKVWLSEGDTLRTRMIATPPSVAASKYGFSRFDTRKQEELCEFLLALWQHYGLSGCQQIRVLHEEKESTAFAWFVERYLLAASASVVDVQLTQYPSFLTVLNGVGKEYSLCLVVDVGFSLTRLTPVVDGLASEAGSDCALGFFGIQEAEDRGRPFDNPMHDFTAGLQRGLGCVAAWICREQLSRQRWCVLISGGGCDLSEVRERVCAAVCETFPHYPILWS